MNYISYPLYLFDRFVPPNVQKKFGITLPDYGFGPNQIALIVPTDGSTGNTATAASTDTHTSEERSRELHTAAAAASVLAPAVVAAGKSSTDGSIDSITAVFATAASTEQAKSIAKGLLEKKLAACVNLVPQVVYQCFYIFVRMNVILCMCVNVVQLSTTVLYTMCLR